MQIFLEEDGVSAVNSVADTLCKSTELFGEGCSPGLTGDGVSDGVCLRNCDVICRVGVLC